MEFDFEIDKKERQSDAADMKLKYIIFYLNCFSLFSESDELNLPVFVLNETLISRCDEIKASAKCGRQIWIDYFIILNTIRDI